MNLETIIDTLSWYKILPLNGFNIVRVKRKLRRKRKRVRKSSSNRRRNQGLYTQTFLQNLENLWRIIMHAQNVHTSSIRDQRHCRKSSTKSDRRNFSCVATVRIGWKMVGCFNGVLLLSAERPRPPSGRENYLWKTIRRTIQRTSHSIWSSGRISSDFDKRSTQASSTWKESFTWNISWICIDCGKEFGKEIFWLLI